MYMLAWTELSEPADYDDPQIHIDRYVFYDYKKEAIAAYRDLMDGREDIFSAHVSEVIYSNYT